MSIFMKRPVSWAFGNDKIIEFVLIIEWSILPLRFLDIQLYWECLELKSLPTKKNWPKDWRKSSGYWDGIGELKGKEAEDILIGTWFIVICMVVNWLTVCKRLFEWCWILDDMITEEPAWVVPSGWSAL